MTTSDTRAATLAAMDLSLAVESQSYAIRQQVANINLSAQGCIARGEPMSAHLVECVNASLRAAQASLADAHAILTDATRDIDLARRARLEVAP